MTKDLRRSFFGDLEQELLVIVDRVEYDPTTKTDHDQHDRTSNGSLSMTVGDAIAAVTGTEPEGREQLQSVVDPDALGAVLSSSKETGFQAEFGYMERSVTVTERS